MKPSRPPSRASPVATTFGPLPSNPQKEVLSNREAQEFLDLSKSTLQRYRDDGTLPYSKLGQNIYYRRSDLHDALEKRRVDGT